MASIDSARASGVGERLRAWRRRRRFSQLAFSLEAEISQKHLSFIESGRAAPSRGMVLHLAERLDVPLRERNAMLLAAGFAPVFPERPLDHDALAPVREAVELVLKAHEPWPAVAIDRHWTILSANGAVPRLLGLVSDASLLQPPANALRIALSPGGLAPHVVEPGAWREHLLARLRGQVAASADPTLAALLDELSAGPAPPSAPERGGGPEDVAILMRLRTREGVASFLSATTLFGTPLDVTVSELAIEAFYPADAETADMFRRLAASGEPLRPA